MGPTVKDPDTEREPDQPPLAVQLDAPDAFQLSVLLPPASTYSGLALRLMLPLL